jgi:ABC-type polysaccharide/polyol phosphate transport system ATPase subunit
VIAITVQNLGKKFKLFSSQGGRFIEYLSMGKFTRHTDFWALQDISFEIPAGTTLGILGQNGSGKSTLLSILAGVLESSAGTFTIQGKVSAILELGSGFHPEFSGRDNVYMYGSIMGLSKPEIDERFDEIVRFSELGDFIDQPLRTYSSGMVVRLAFSVAVNVNADILIVDEALAVGDAIFQHRCFRKIRTMQAAGKTILYVGHDTDAVRNLCTYALLLDGGRIIERGDPNTVVNKYHALIAERERTYSEANLIEHGEVLGEGYKTVYDFIRNLPDATIENAKGIPVQPQTVEILSSPRRVLFSHAPSKITYTVPIGTGSSLAFAIGILPGAWDKIPQGVKFDIEIGSSGLKENIFSRVLQPRRNIGDRGWHNFLVPLEKYYGKTVFLTFITSGSGNDLSYGWSAWGWGKIVKKIQINICDDKEMSLNCDLLESGGGQSVNPSSPFLGKKIRYGNKKLEIVRVTLNSIHNVENSIFKSGETASIKIFIKKNENVTGKLTIGCNIKNKYSEIYGTNTRWEDCDIDIDTINNNVLVEMIFPLKLASGIYSITAAIACIHEDNAIEIFDRKEDCLLFRIQHDKPIVGYIDLEAKFKISLDFTE